MRLNRFKTAAVVALIAAGAGTLIQPAVAADNAADNQQGFSFGVIGDIPYGAAEIAKFPARIQDINADSALKFVTPWVTSKTARPSVRMNTSSTSAPSSILSSIR